MQNKQLIRKPIIAILGIIFLISCISKTTKNVNNERNNLIESLETKKDDKLKVSTDTIAYLNNIGKKILNGVKISKFEEKDIIKLVHSVMNPDSIDRVFYFKVLNEISKQSEGEIAEISSWEIKDFCNVYPNDFFRLTNSELKTYALEIGEIIRTEEESPLDYAKNYMSEIRQKIKPELSDKVETFSKNMEDAIAER